ncbi:MAG: dephospho-CoA kinase [Nitrospirota bacterium]
MIIVGLTGNYGMGKSTVARLFRELGAFTIDTDAVVGELLGEQPVIDAVKNAFGEEVVRDSTIDRQRLAGIVFQSAPLRIALENILHPKVFDAVKEKIAALGSRADVVIIEAPVLFERSYQSKFDRIITVFADEETTLKRLQEKGVSEEEAMRRLSSQFPIEMKANRADFTIDNSAGLESTRQQVQAIYRKLQALSRGSAGHPSLPGSTPYGNN